MFIQINKQNYIFNIVKNIKDEYVNNLTESKLIIYIYIYNKKSKRLKYLCFQICNVDVQIIILIYNFEKSIF
jgi:hypothetical protein